MKGIIIRGVDMPELKEDVDTEDIIRKMEALKQLMSARNSVEENKGFYETILKIIGPTVDAKGLVDKINEQYDFLIKSIDNFIKFIKEDDLNMDNLTLDNIDSKIADLKNSINNVKNLQQNEKGEPVQI